MSEVAEMLQTYGGWGVSTALGFTVAAMWRYIKGVHAEQRQEGKDQTAALVEVRDAMRAFKEVMEKLADKLETRQ
jgi:hypothetical protein